MRPTRIMQYVQPDDWKDEEVAAVKYPLTEDGWISGVHLVGLEIDRRLDDRTGPRRVEGVFADEIDGCRLHFPEHDKGRNFGKLEDDRRPNGHLWMHKWPITPIEELQTPWVSVYGHAPGEGYGMSYCILTPMSVRHVDVLCLIGRFETYRAERIIAHLDRKAPPGVKIFLEWLRRPGRYASHVAGGGIPLAQWITYGTPAVLWCCPPAEADALWRAMARMLSVALIAAFAKNKDPECKYYCEDPRKVMAEHLLDVTKTGDDGRYLAAAAFRRLGGDLNHLGFQRSLARQSSMGIVDPEIESMKAIAKRIGMTGDDLRRLAEAERMLGLS